MDTSRQFYSKCVSDISEFFELPHDKCLDGSFSAPSKETIDSLEMIGEVLRDTITELPVSQSEAKLISKALTTKVNEHQNVNWPPQRVIKLTFRALALHQL